MNRKKSSFTKVDGRIWQVNQMLGGLSIITKEA
jgi:hypothetical protein